MIETPEIILQEVSDMLNESSTDTSSKRISYFNRAFQHLCNQFKWAFRIKDYSLTTSTGVKEYDLTNLIDDYDSSSGVYEVWDGNTQLVPVDYESKGSGLSGVFYLTPDKKSIGFTFDIDGTEEITIKYFAIPKRVSSATETLNIPIPQAFIVPLATYIKHLVHEAKRQRYDSRNALLDFQEQLSDLKIKDASSTANGLPRHQIKNYMATRVVRRYS